MSFEVNVLVNGSRCKQYLSNGRIFIESKKESEYAIEIKNNTHKKVLAVVSVDGINIIDGESKDENGPGYIIDNYSSQKLYGYQYSNEKVATFKFGNVGSGYASSKKDGSEKNSGVIGVRIWDEVEPVKIDRPPIIIKEYTPTPWTPHPYDPYKPYWVTYGTTTDNILRSADNNVINCSCLSTPDSFEDSSFDTETQWGQPRDYKVTEATFNRKSIIHSVDIYYSSREGLISMGVEIKPEKKVNFPESFKSTKYASPPDGWKG